MARRDPFDPLNDQPTEIGIAERVVLVGPEVAVAQRRVEHAAFAEGSCPGDRPLNPLILDCGKWLHVRLHLDVVIELILQRKVFQSPRDRAVRINDLDIVLTFLGLAIREPHVREDSARASLSTGDASPWPRCCAMDRDIPVAGSDEIENRLLLAGCEFEFVVATVGHDDQDVIFTHGRSFHDGGFFTDCHLEPAGILERSGEVQCLIAVSVMLALPARKQEDLGAIGHFLLGQSRVSAASKTRSRST